jgi:hypothetical protein
MSILLASATTTSLVISEAEAQDAARKYVADEFDPAFEVVKGFLLAREQPRWRFVVRSPHGPLGYLFVAAGTGAVVPLNEDEKRVVRERALIAAAESRHERPMVAQGHVPAEYARRRANGYLTEQLGLYYSAMDGHLTAQGQPLWQFTIRFRLPRRGAAGVVGELSVDARTGDPLPLTSGQLKKMQGRAHALIGT